MEQRDPRIARFGVYEYRLFRGRLQWRIHHLPHEVPDSWCEDRFTPEDYAAVAALREHPTEEESAA